MKASSAKAMVGSPTSQAPGSAAVRRNQASPMATKGGRRRDRAVIAIFIDGITRPVLGRLLVFFIA